MVRGEGGEMKERREGRGAGWEEGEEQRYGM